jgi:hypothetical protein
MERLKPWKKLREFTIKGLKMTKTEEFLLLGLKGTITGVCLSFGVVAIWGVVWVLFTVNEIYCN